jgi:nitroreductase
MTMQDTDFIPLPDYRGYPEEEMLARAHGFYHEMRRRRTVRSFSTRDVPRAIIEQCLLAAGTAPNGANMQPWHFVVVHESEMKQRIRVGAENEEESFYEWRAPEEWLQALEPFGTDHHKPFLEDAPYLIIVFAQSYGLGPDGERIKHYYVQESVGIATGILVTALHHAGLVTLTHTPSPMGFLNELLKRPDNERPYLILVTGYPAEDVKVPKITKKSLDEIATFM